MDMPGIDMPGMEMPEMKMPQGHDMKMEDSDAGKPSSEPTGEMPMPMGEPPRGPAPDSGEMPMDHQMDMGGQNCLRQPQPGLPRRRRLEIGRAPCRDRCGQVV